MLKGRLVIMATLIPLSCAHCKLFITSVEVPDEEIPNTSDFFICELVLVLDLWRSHATIHWSKPTSLINDVATTPDPGHIAFFVPFESLVISTAAWSATARLPPWPKT